MTMELGLLKALLNKDFYEKNRVLLDEPEIFSKDVRKIKDCLDLAMEKYETDLTTEDLQAVFHVTNKTMTTATKVSYDDLFRKMQSTKAVHGEIAQDALSSLFQQKVGEKVTQMGFAFVNGEEDSLEPLRRLLDNYKNDFTPSIRVDWDDISIETLLEADKEASQWTFNIPSLRRKIEGISGGHLIMIGARPNTGKTSFHASLIAGPDGFAHQGAKCIVLCNEESYERVGARYLTAATNMTMDEVHGNISLATERYAAVKRNVWIKDCTSKTLSWVEAVVKHEKPDVVVLDMGDKFASKTSDKTDVYLKEAATHARNIAKQYNCAVIWMSQLSAVAEGKVFLDQSMMEGSKTGKAAESDLMVLISKNPQVEGADEQDTQRHLNIAKNKLKKGWHGVIHCDLDGDRSLYTS
tara:strand:- start:188 stop:1417 length:1230 start_codon:yes stop_codon:yes gene_type:complete